MATLLLAALAAAACAAPLEVDTEYGRIRGKELIEPRVTGYYGIPYASPPVKNLRLRSPIPPTPWSDTRDCTKDSYFNICPQFHEGKKFFAGQEDCLYMNIFVPPTSPPAGGFPVMFWIYGGGYTMGDGYEIGYYRGQNLAAFRDVIVVEHNYRLGALGFWALPELQAESAANSTGNYALQDQQAALAFTYRNIAKFGGNPNKITIFGESAGAFSVCWHLVSEVSRPYLAGAIMESGTCSSPEFFFSLPRAFNFGREMVTMIGCNTAPDVLACLRNKPTLEFFLSNWPDPATHDIPPLAPSMPYGPVIDGSRAGLLGLPIDLMARGRYAHVPLIIGTNLNEGTLFVLDVDSIVPGAKLPIDDESWNLTLLHFFNESTAAAVNEQYTKAQYGNNDNRAAFLLRDFFFTCNARRIALTLSSQGTPVYLYQFTQRLSNWVDYLLFGDYHSLELPFVFDHQWPPGAHWFNPDEEKLAMTTTTYWSNLAKYGNPNGKLGPGQVDWPVFNNVSRMNILLEHPVKVTSHLLGEQCDFWMTHFEKYYFQ